MTEYVDSPAFREYLTFYGNSVSWWENVKGQKYDKWWGKNQTQAHLDQARKVYAGFYFHYNPRLDKSNGIETFIRQTIEKKDSLSDEMLMYIYYDDLRLRLQEDFGKDSALLPGKWEQCSPYHTYLQFTIGKSITKQMFELYDALKFIHDEKPSGLANKLEKYINIWDERLHEGMGKKCNDKLQRKFTCAKAALLMVLQCWHKQYWDALPNTPLIEIKIETDTKSLPLHWNHDVMARTALKNNSEIPLKDFRVKIKLDEATAKVIEIRLDGKTSDLFFTDITSWTPDKPLDLDFPIRQKAAISSSEMKLRFLVNIESNHAKPKINLNPDSFEITSRLGASLLLNDEFPQGPKNEETLRNWYEARLNRIVVNKEEAWKVFLMDVIKNLNIDEASESSLMPYFEKIENRKLLNELCVRLAEKIMASEFPYLGVTELEAVLKEFNLQISTVLKQPENEKGQRFLIALDEAIRSNGNLPNAPLGSIMEHYGENKPDIADLLKTIEELIVQGWCQQDEGVLYRFTTPAHRMCAANQFK